MNAKLILTTRNGEIVSAVATGTIEVTVHDLDIRFQPAAIHQMTPDLCTIEQMTHKLRDLGLVGRVTPCAPTAGKGLPALPVS